MIPDLFYNPLRVFPYAPIINPVPTPNHNINDSPLTRVCINDDYIPLILGVLEALSWTDAWYQSGLDIEATLQQIELLKASFINGNCGGGEDMRIRQGSNPCVMEFSYDGGITWNDKFDFALCLNSATSTIDYDLAVEVNVTATNLNNVYLGNATDIAVEGQDYTDTPNNALRDTASCYTWYLFLSTYNNDLKGRLSSGKRFWNWLVEANKYIAQKTADLFALLLTSYFGPLGGVVGLMVREVSEDVNNYLKDNLTLEPDNLIMTEVQLQQLAKCLGDYVSGAMITETIFKTIVSSANCAIVSSDIENALTSIMQSDDLYLVWLELQEASYATMQNNPNAINDYCDINAVDELVTFDPGGYAYTLEAYTDDHGAWLAPTIDPNGITGNCAIATNVSNALHNADKVIGCSVRVDLPVSSLITGVSLQVKQIMADSGVRCDVDMYDVNGYLVGSTNGSTKTHNTASWIEHIINIDNVPNVRRLHITTWSANFSAGNLTGSIRIDDIHIY